MAMAIQAVFLTYGRENLNPGLSVLDNFIERVFTPTQYSRLIVDNRSCQGQAEDDGSILVIGGDNSSREFSGWDCGIGWLHTRAQLSDDTVMVLANDTFYRNYGSAYLGRFDPEIVCRQVSEGDLVGYVDGYPQPVQLFGFDVQYWIRTSIFLCRWKTLKRLLPLTVPCTNKELFSEDQEEFFRQPSPLSANYQEYLRVWLFKPPDEDAAFQETWHSKRSLTAVNLQEMQSKARSIVCEHYLSARAMSLGIPVRSVNLNFM